VKGRKKQYLFSPQ